MNRVHSYEKQELRRILDEHGEASSEDLMIVLDNFLDLESHQTASELHHRLQSRGLKFDLEFVEKALDIFCHFGLAQAKIFNGHEPSYEHRHLGRHHDHLICTRCGKVEEFSNPQMENLQKDVARTKGFVPLQHRMDIYGLCAECARQRGSAVPLSEAETGEKMLVCGHLGGDELQRRLMDMGLNKGAEVEVLSCNGGPTIVACRGSRLALGRGLCEKVLVTPCESKDFLHRHRWRGRRKFRRLS